MYTVHIKYIQYAHKEVIYIDILISNSSPLPIYEQIETQMKQQIISGQLPAGQLLPSMRALAKNLQISIITTKRAYEELERDGFIQTVQGKGSFVAPQSAQFLQEVVLSQIEQHLYAAIETAQKNKITREQMFEILGKLYDIDSQEECK